MNSPKRYITRMVFFLIAVGGACTLLYPALENAFLTNPGLNGLILLVLMFGVILNFRSVFMLRKEIRWLKAPALSLEPAVLKKLRLLSPLALVLKNNKAKAVRFSTLEALCKALDCQPGELLEYVEEEP